MWWFRGSEAVRLGERATLKHNQNLCILKSKCVFEPELRENVTVKVCEEAAASRLSSSLLQNKHFCISGKPTAGKHSFILNTLNGY